MINTTQVEKKHLKNGVLTTNERLSMQEVYLNTKKEELVITNGHILVSYKVEDCENDESAIIPIDAFDTNFILK